MNEENLIKYYNKFNEEKRLTRRHGKIEFIVTMKYIHDYLNKMSNPKIIDIGAGCGAYSIPLSNEGYDVTAVELVKHNLRIIEKKSENIKIYQGNAVNLKKFADDTYDLTLLFGPMYHLISEEEKIKALSEAKRITKPNGIIMVAYCMNDYALIKYGFIDNNINKSIDKIKDFKIISNQNDLYSYVTIDDINRLNNNVNLERLKIISPEGPSDYIRPIINKMDDETFDKFIEYCLNICERPDLIGAGSHTVDILKKTV